MRRASTLVLVVALLILGLGLGYAQQIFSGYYGYTPPRWPTANTFKGAFNMCRVMFTSNRREKRGWDTDYPGADINFSVRLSELTRTRVTKQPNHGEPEYVVVRITDQALFQCPFVLFEDAGTALFNDQEVKQLREYFLKGGFAFVSDYWGPLAKEQFDEQIGRVLPHEKYPIIDLPMDHPIWHTQFELKHLPQMASIQSWRRTGGGVTERGLTPGNQSARAVVDQKGRVMVVMIHDDDIPDGWEREGEEREVLPSFLARCLFSRNRRPSLRLDALRSRMKLTTFIVAVFTTTSLFAQQVTKKEIAGISTFAQVETTIACGGATKPEAIREVAKMGFKSVINLRLASEQGAMVEEEGAAVKAAGMNYVHLPFDAQNPDAHLIDNFIAAVTAPANQPAYVHCAAGGRAASLWMVKRVLADGWDEQRALTEANALGLNDRFRPFALNYIHAHAK